MRRLFTLTILSILIPAAALASDSRTLRGRVTDATGQVVRDARVTLGQRTVLTDENGGFVFDNVPAQRATLTVRFLALPPVTVPVAPDHDDVAVTLDLGSISDRITVTAAHPKLRITSATKTDTPLRDVPQAVSVVTRDVIEQHAMQSIADVVRYVPGVGMASGEGNRDTPIFRGNHSTSNFFVDGVRDDVQYFRDLYNVERVEALKGPNAMIFGRGGVGGVINRVVRKADFSETRELRIQGGSWNDRRFTGDFGQALTELVAGRITAMYEKSDSYREGASLERYGANPTLAFSLGDNTSLTASYEFFHDERTADRGISSFAGRPVETDASTFFGNADLSNSEVDVHALHTALEHRLSENVTLRNRTGYAMYDKFYQNVYPGSVDAAGERVSISAYNNGTKRDNLFNQTDLIVKHRSGRIEHTVLAGLEFGRQVTDNLRHTGYFSSVGPNVTSVMVPLANPTTTLPLTFRQSATDADNHGVATVAGLYVQDQMTLGRFDVIGGLRYERFQTDLRNNRNGADLTATDNLVSPRLGLVYRPVATMSLYGSYSVSYLPRSGDQLSSLTISNAALDPEEYRNVEAGLKWDATPGMSMSAAVYQLERGNVAIAHPTNPNESLLVDGERTRGLELEAAGNITRAWSVLAAYTWQDGEITRSLSSNAPAGARLAQLPEHSIALWNRYDISARWGVGAGVMHRTEVFTSTDNAVLLPGFTRVDAALFYDLNDSMALQVNVENLLDTEYYAFAHSNTNITPGAPRALRVTWATRF
ncbi:MAG TPA: TonB-dependent siderophore receptor [Thermoanaerobaculia bacterium]|nr:TonB-dependent siderophore receptor [Thermoanaerobaculia bacterium]